MGTHRAGTPRRFHTGMRFPRMRNIPGITTLLPVLSFSGAAISVMSLFRWVTGKWLVPTIPILEWYLRHPFLLLQMAGASLILAGLYPYFRDRSARPDLTLLVL